MRLLITILTLGLFAFGASAQPGNAIGSIGEKDSCYLRYDANGEKLKGNQRYTEWQCGKLVGIVDCNDRLEYDEESDIVYLNSRDLTNAAGAGKPFSGTCETCYMNGMLERRITFVNGKENGPDTTYYKTGCPQVIRNHVQGAATGQWLFMYDSTQYLAWEMNYVLGQKHGKHIFFKKNGDTTKWENYNYGRLDGIKRTYYPDSKIKQEINYKEGVIEGKFTMYNVEGVVIEDLNYKNGKKNEECKYYYDDGKPLKNEHWNMGVKNGEFKVFFYQGQLQKTEIFKNDVKEGWHSEFYPDESLKHKILYAKNVLIEEYKYDENGREKYAFPEYKSGGDEDDAAPSVKSKEEDRKKFLKAHKKKMLKEAKKKAKAAAKLKKQQAKKKKEKKPEETVE